jgi:hypothetical protein
MKLSDSDLQQLDEARVLRMQPEHKDKLLVTLISDLKEARERLNANSQNSSRPPRTDPPWSNANDAPVNNAPANNATPAAKAPPESKGTTPKSTEAAAPDTGTVIAPIEAPLKRKVGHQVGEEGHGRHLTLPVSFIHTHSPSHCVLCGDALNTAHFRATGGHYVLDIDITAHEGLAGIRVKHEKHLYGEIVCACGHKNDSQPGSCPDDPLWVNLSMNERGLVGPVLASLIVCLAKRMRLSRFRIQEYLHDWLRIDLSTSTINRCIHEAGRAVEPLEEEMVKELKTAALLYADETPWKEWGQLLWLWVIISPSICLYLIGDRSKELLANIFGDQIDAWLMSDGYKVYRKYQKRLRCWAHIIRKAKGLEEAFDPEVRMFGNQANQLLERLMQAIYQARESPPTTCLTVTFADDLAAFKQRCEEHRDSRHDKTKALARELLNDWESFWIVLKHPHLPLTNNEAERALRHWVIARLITQGTRTSQGTRAFGLLASVIETCRKRNILPWPYLALVIAERRKGNPAPSLPPMALAV